MTRFLNSGDKVSATQWMAAQTHKALKKKITSSSSGKSGVGQMNPHTILGTQNPIPSRHASQRIVTVASRIGSQSIASKQQIPFDFSMWSASQQRSSLTALLRAIPANGFVFPPIFEYMLHSPGFRRGNTLNDQLAHPAICWYSCKFLRFDEAKWWMARTSSGF